eukprot:CAMPEP_0194319340 /NCGR_PEP_ID=MMETSP0171-20130528/15798_1 /TAXON_ID=218684 /ORGANISM="Corethron pennatum, Strain L29A3" /LENGTH=375 /DNA_ID=CAMNT_0039076521 /DNA_START=53 /DNA_END=1181 /DNA_ORIENTATION=-
MILSCFNNANLTTAISFWFSNRTLAEIRYGPIEIWPTCQVTSFNKLFYYAKDFNEDLSGWDVSSVTSMQSCFAGATYFTVTNNPLLYSASSFNGGISEWDTSRVESMRGMFSHAVSFNVNLSGWDVARVETMYALFIEANSFNQALTWCLGDGVVTKYMFVGSGGRISERCSSPSPSTSPTLKKSSAPSANVLKTSEPTYITAAPSASLVFQNDTAAPSSSQTTDDFLFSDETMMRVNENVGMFSNSKFVIGLSVFAFISSCIALFVIRRNRSMEQVVDEEQSIENGAGDDVLENRTEGFIRNFLTMITNFPRVGDNSITSNHMERSGDDDADAANSDISEASNDEFVASVGSIDRPTAVCRADISPCVGNARFY